MTAVQSEVPLATRQAQDRASNPKGSAWVSANAGSGKTYVLTQRVLRLLLDGADPATLLCLTFTKAAAAEMATRVFDSLAEWTRYGDDTLRTKLQDIQGRASVSDLERARGLFARALETPGGLKIQTIHAFCESLLHQFPLEAQVAASFMVLDDRDAAALMEQARGDVITHAARGENPALRTAFQGLASRFADTTIGEHLDAILNQRQALLRRFDRLGLDDHAARLAHLLDAHAAMLGFAKSDTPSIQADLEYPIRSSTTLANSQVEALLETARRLGTPRDQDRAQGMMDAWLADDATESQQLWDRAFLTKDGKPRAVEKSYFAKKVKAAYPDVGLWLKAEQERVLGLRAHIAFADLMQVALAVLERFEALKAHRGALDFGDLITRAAALLTRSQAQAWVRYKMDQRIDHVLVDEAQDTSADQWAIINALTDDFFAGEGARPSLKQPTFFAVGDEKQSIYSFQGADPRHFETTRRTLETKAADAEMRFESPVSLVLSFRSSPDILAAVDQVFSRQEALNGVSSDLGLTHEARRKTRGRVELWPVIKGIRAEEPEDWTAPVDALPAPHLRLAKAIGRRVRSLVDGGTSPGEILILLRTRGAIADAINRELKAQHVAVAGTDRLLLTDHIAVQDMMSLMQVVLLPEDDLTLACLLTSPLIGLSDDDLESLCVGRDGLLIDALNAPTTNPAIRQAAQDVKHWRALADQVTPFWFLATVLGRDGGRRKLLSRLGEDARDPLDELLRLARAEETRPGSSLANLEAFLGTLRHLHLDIKRDMEARADKVRIMTVHGSKGLEAKTVFLVDTCRLPRAPSGLVELPSDGDSRDDFAPPLLLLAGDTHATAYQEVKERGQQRQLEEYRRLLYVAMTRAGDQLIVTGHMTSDGEVPSGCWYDLIDRALDDEARDVGDLDGLPDGEPVRIWQTTPFPTKDIEEDRRTSAETAPKPDPAFFDALKQRPSTPSVAPSLRPSAARHDIALDAQSWPARADSERLQRTLATMREGPENRALQFGTLVHKLLEPADAVIPEKALRLAHAIDPDVPSEMLELAQQQANAVRALPEAAVLFGPSARSEVALRGAFAAGAGAHRPITGSIDRLVVLPSEIWAIDFKTNTHPPQTDKLDSEAADYVIQLALYADQLAQLWPNKKTKCGLIWTALPRLDWLADSMVADALSDLRK